MSNDTRISTQIQALQTDKTNIRQAILDKNGTCASGNGFDDFATDIATIPSGITPTGSVSIAENGTYDVTDKAQAVVNVSGGGGGTIAVLEGDVTVSSQSQYFDINHTLGKVPIYAECFGDNEIVGTYPKITRAANVAGWICDDETSTESNELITITRCKNSNGVYTNNLQNKAATNYTSRMTNVKVRFGKTNQNACGFYYGTYHYKIYYEA